MFGHGTGGQEGTPSEEDFVETIHQIEKCIQK
jgi:hypothetical protein